MDRVAAVSGDGDGAGQHGLQTHQGSRGRLGGAVHSIGARCLQSTDHNNTQVGSISRSDEVPHQHSTHRRWGECIRVCGAIHRAGHVQLRTDSDAGLSVRGTGLKNNRSWGGVIVAHAQNTHCRCNRTVTSTSRSDARHNAKRIVGLRAVRIGGARIITVHT